ncbi:DUF1604-domain-containing protein [Basidiobolus meristosporus CBS 931.73]|uniref:DUF1604-domain-containing protein n=1 Tax=Basidiobolus meristosporus CBS 931.73 TaxID=1314790 RepID=A0A1Y1Y6Y5_9FUNG|nr:DUF1604-domain-containing protein [Basidiobolus meristosporus CBS 931.73]|eukprot:ORX93655.1 DUF1604-domain-containing protein [Basidiobolus meristosporus CBS 931.73]
MSYYRKRPREGDSDRESFVTVGTVLEDLGSGKDGKKAVPVWEQEVRDEKGRRRFHGAFTGGFSAGYFNTVGSKEGWEPKTFVSSRTSRSERKAFRPEDYMDEEDLAELADSQKLVTKDDFGKFGSTERDLARRRATADSLGDSSTLGAIPDSLLESFVIPSKEPVGVRLLKSMGWREGQGIGPRLSIKKQKNLASYDSELFKDAHASNFKFAPKDTAVISFTNKNNRYGIDYDPYNDNSGHSMRQSSDYYTSGVSYSAKRSGFGMEDDDDHDIYSTSSKADYNTSLFDDDDDDQPMVIGMSKKPSRPSRSSDYEYSKAKANTTTVVVGFIQATLPMPADKWFNPPDIPAGFNPYHRLGSQAPPPNHLADKQAEGSRRHVSEYTADQRGAMLGEEKINAPSRSVFDYISKDNKDRLNTLINGTTSSREKPDVPRIPKVEKKQALAALSGFIPFGDNIEKQNRYKQFLEYNAEIIKSLPPNPRGFSDEDLAKEHKEFAQAARIFHPMSSMMASRFTSASSESIIEEFKQPVPGLRPGPGPAEAKEQEPPQANKKPKKQESNYNKSPAAEAAAMNMFGQLTRSTTPFYPARLLCKRFNVPNPHPEYTSTTQPGKSSAGSREALSKESLDSIVNDSSSSFTAGLRQPTKPVEVKSFVSATTVEPDVQAKTPPAPQPAPKETVVPERPPMDIFKAIFADSDEE